MKSGTVNNRYKWLRLALIYWGVCAIVVGTASYALGQEADGTNCPSGVSGLCTPGVFESATETVTETTETSGTGTTTTTTTTTETTTTTVTNPETGDLLTDQKVQEMGRNNRFGGDMTKDWGGQGAGGIRNGATCGDLGTDKCAELPGSGTFTSTLGQQGIGSTYIQHINMSSIDPDIDRGGQVPWSIRVEKRDASDSIHFRIRKTDGTTTTLLGSETLSAAGANVITNTLFQGNFNFSGAITTLSVEVSGRDVGLAIGPLFDDVTVNVIYNVVNTIVTETITTIEEFVALGTFDQETIDVATDIFENNNISQNDIGEVTIEPVGPEPQGPEPSFESVEMEMNTEMSMPEIKMEMDLPPPPVEVQTSEQNVEVEIEMEMKNDINDNVASTAGPDTKPEPTSEGGASKSDTATEEPKSESEVAEGSSEASENSEEGGESESSSVEKPTKTAAKAEKKESKPKTKAEKKQEAKQKAATKIVKKMGDKGRYDDTNQMKTLVVMQVLGDTKSFFDNQLTLQDTPGFFDSTTVPDAVISDNNYAQYLMFGGSDAAHNALTESQYR